MRILGIDPGTATTGYGIIEVGKEGLRVSEYGCVRTSTADSLPVRLASLYEQVMSLILQQKPCCMAVEEVFFNKNTRTALAVGQARGVVLLAAAHAELPVAEYTPLQVKQAITGYGRASKAQMQRMVKVLLNLPQLPAPDDAADALAVAICHASCHNFRKKVEGVGGF